MSNVIKFQPPIPSYAVDLLLRAKMVLASTPEQMPQSMKRLNDAVFSFEQKMPLKDGEIMETAI